MCKWGCFITSHYFSGHATTTFSHLGSSILNIKIIGTTTVNISGDYVKAYDFQNKAAWLIVVYCRNRQRRGMVVFGDNWQTSSRTHYRYDRSSARVKQIK